MNRITYEERKEIYDKFRRERRQKIAATWLLGGVLIATAILFMGCSSPRYLTGEEKIELLKEEWREVYKDVQDSPPGTYYPAPANTDFEVEYLNGLLNPHGITAFRINPHDPDHQFRYRRYLEEPIGFSGIQEEDI